MLKINTVNCYRHNKNIYYNNYINSRQKKKNVRLWPERRRHDWVNRGMSILSSVTTIYCYRGCGYHARDTKNVLSKDKTKSVDNTAAPITNSLSENAGEKKK